MAYDCAESTEASQLEQQQRQHSHPGLADVVHELSKDSALARLRLTHLCGSPARHSDARGASQPVDVQLFRPFHYCSDLLAAEAAAEVAADPLTLKDCSCTAQVSFVTFLFSICSLLHSRIAATRMPAARTVDVQLFGSFHFCSKLLAAKVAAGPLALEDCSCIAQSALWRLFSFISLLYSRLIPAGCVTRPTNMIQGNISNMLASTILLQNVQEIGYLY
jgi:hypothetical protein